MKRMGLWVLLALALFAGPLIAADTTDEKINELQQKIEQLQKQIEALQTAAPSAEVEELKRQIAILAQEIEKLRSGDEETALDDAARAALGLGPSAARVYSKKQGVSIAGYGEMLYQNLSEDRIDQIDFLRAVVYVGYRFNDRFLFNSEIEFEHATTGEGSEELGEASVEFANIDYRINDDLTLRGGLLLVPMGLINEFHEPNVYLGARRPLTETQIIPSTWSENGFGIAGHSGILDYRAYVIAGLNAAGFAADGIRESRQHGSNSAIFPAFVARGDVTPTSGFTAGGSIYAGQSAFIAEEAGATPEFTTFIGEVHALYRAGAWDVRGLYAWSSIDNVAELNKDLGLEEDESVAKSMAGGYVQAGYDLLTRRNGNVSLIPYLRYEKINTQKSVAAPYVANPELDVTVWTFGAEFKPIPNIVLKADYQNFDNQADSGADQFNINLGYSF